MKKLIATTLVTTGCVVGAVVGDPFLPPQAHAQWCNDGTFSRSGTCIAHGGDLGGPVIEPCGLIQIAAHDPCAGPPAPAPLFFTAETLSEDSSAQVSKVAHRQIVVSCPTDLHRTVGQEERCTFEDQGQGYWLDASVVPAAPIRSQPTTKCSQSGPPNRTHRNRRRATHPVVPSVDGKLRGCVAPRRGQTSGV